MEPKKWISVIVLPLLASVLAPVAAQCNPTLSLATAAPSTGQAGVMFDMEPVGGVPLRIDSFDVHVTGTALTYEVWVRPPLQSFVGFNTSNAGWTLLGTATGINGLGTATAVPLNMCLNYTLQTGGRTGFYVTTVAAGTHWYFSGGTVGAVGTLWVSNAQLAIYSGNAGTYFNPTISPRAFGGAVRYDLGSNILAISQSGPGVGDLSVSLSMLTAGATEGWTLLTSDISGPVGGGPILGLRPDAVTWSLLSIPLIDGNPFHFPVPSAFGFFPNTPFNLGPGAVSALTGQTFDFACFLLSGPAYAGRSQAVRFAFQ